MQHLTRADPALKKPKAGLQIDTRENLLKGSSDNKVIKIGDAANSLFTPALSCLQTTMILCLPREILSPPLRKQHSKSGLTRA